MSGHTPGPWRAKSTVSVVAKKRHTRFDGSFDEYDGEVAWTRPVSRENGGEATRLANARLIAAAPTLLEALEDARLFVDLLRTHWSNWHDDPEQVAEADDCLSKIDAAINAATGGQQ
jgi:hypothetical protein